MVEDTEKAWSGVGLVPRYKTTGFGVKGIKSSITCRVCYQLLHRRINEFAEKVLINANELRLEDNEDYVSITTLRGAGDGYVSRSSRALGSQRHSYGSIP